MAATDFLATIVNGVVETFEPLTDALQSTQGVGALLAQFGWGFDNSQTATAYASPFAAVQTELTNLQAFVSAPSADSFVSIVTPLVTEINNLSGQLSGATLTPFTDPTFQQTFPAELVDYLIYEYVRANMPRLFAALSVLQIFDAPQVAAQGTRGVHFHRVINWNDMFAAIGNPQGVFAPSGPFAWGTSAFDSVGLTRALCAGLSAFGMPAIVVEPEPTLATAYYGSLSQAQSQQALTAIAPILSSFDNTGSALSALNITAGVMPIPPADAPTGVPDGFVLFLNAAGNFQEATQVTDVMTLSVGGQFTTTGGLRVDVHPGTSQVNTALLPAGTSLGANLTLALANADGSPFILIGSANADRAQVQSAHLKISATGTVGPGSSTVPPAEFVVELAADQMAVYLDLSQSDGFLQDLLGSAPQSVQGSFGIRWSSLKGFSFDGQAQLSATIPLHFSLAGIVDIDTVTVALVFTDGSSAAGQASLVLNIGVTGDLSLGPITATVQNMGVALSLTDSSTPRAANEVRSPDVSFGFKPPDGLGVEIEAEAVSGGGFVSFDAIKQEYAGGLELTIEMFQLKAFGVLDTTMPDGSKGYSFVIIISADFPPITLGFGFFLSGVGGLLGVNRSMAIDPLRAAFRAHTIDDIVFLKGDIVSQAPTLIQGIAAIFPPLDSHFVIGPFVTITWGDPALLTAELGLIISLPDPVTLAILGAIIVGVPDPDTPLILLNLDVLGTWDCDAKKIEIDASLYNSYIAAFTIQGDSAFLLNYGESPSFALSVGGLNPQFQPPPGFPTLAAMAINLGNGGNPGIGVLGYFAVTSNSVQHGAKAHLTATASGFGVDGHLGYDILIAFNPFGFMIDLHAELDVLAGGGVLMSIHLDGMLSGPSPWHIHGDAGFSILFFSVSVNIDATFGQSATSQNPPSVSTYTPFNAALQDYHNWSATLPPDAGRVATLAAAPSAASVVAHPLGTISFQQTVVPLSLQISKFGNAIPSDGTLFTVTGVELNGTASPLSSANTVMGEFADGQFIALSDQDKISKPSYTSHASGAVFTSGTILAPFSIETDVAYQTFVEDDLVAGPQPGSPYQPYQSTVLALSANGASARSPRRQATAQRYIAPGLTSAVGVNADLYLVASALNNNPRVDIVPTPASYYEVEAALSTYLGSHPGEAQTLQILAVYELQGAA